MKLEDQRREYNKSHLRRKDLNDDPIIQLQAWLEDASHLGVIDSTAMTLATVNQDGQPSQRVVLLKHLDEKGLVFYTNLNSRKAQDIKVNSKVSANFSWLALERQVKVEGVATQLSTKETLNYFITRPRESQLAAWASNQSHSITSRQVLLTAFEQMKEKFKAGKIPLPDFWGGYRITPTAFEFWQGGSHRLHDRFAYTQDNSDWKIDRLAP